MPLLLRRKMLDARPQGQSALTYVARKIAEDHGISDTDAADALADVVTQQRFAFLSAGFRPQYLHWHVVASRASFIVTLRADCCSPPPPTLHRESWDMIRKLLLVTVVRATANVSSAPLWSNALDLTWT